MQAKTKTAERSENDMAKTSNLYARIEPEVKEQAETILSALGIPVSNAINMFYKQIILQRGIPFEMKLPLNRVPDLGQLTSAQLDAELEKGYTDIAAGRTKPADAVFDSIRKDYGV
jgi:DNA-damage-inducible protein J